MAKQYNFFCCGFNIEIINSEVIDKILNNNLIITVYSEKNIKVNEAKELWSKGVSSIFTDDPSGFKLL